MIDTDWIRICLDGEGVCDLVCWYNTSALNSNTLGCYCLCVWYRASVYMHTVCSDMYSHVNETVQDVAHIVSCLLYTSPSPRDATLSRMPSSA